MKRLLILFKKTFAPSEIFIYTGLYDIEINIPHPLHYIDVVVDPIQRNTNATV